MTLDDSEWEVVGRTYLSKFEKMYEVNPLTLLDAGETVGDDQSDIIWETSQILPRLIALAHAAYEANEMGLHECQELTAAVKEVFGDET